jgi:hypothetical protein
MRREARRLRRDGFEKAAQAMALGAAQAGMAERPTDGPRWKSRETKMAESAFANQQQALDNRNAARLARVTNMQIAADEKRLSEFLNPSTASPAATSTTATTPAATSTRTPSPTTATSPIPFVGPPSSAASIPVVGPPTPPPSTLDSLYGSTVAQQEVAKQGLVNGKPEGQFAYEERLRLRELGVNKGKMGAAETAYWKSLQEKKDQESRDRIKKQSDKNRRSEEQFESFKPKFDSSTSNSFSSARVRGFA